MSMQKAQRQMPAKAGREAAGHGEAMLDAFSDEAFCPRHATGDTGSALLQAALTTENLRRAFKRVRANKGAAGVDGLDINQTSRLLAIEWPNIREQLLTGTYRPQPVRRVTIPKPDGGERELGIPTVTDRLIQQALLQVLQPILDPTFSEHSYGFRPGRRAQDAVLAAQTYVQSGLKIVVDVDLSKFFDRVNHDILIDRLRKRVDDVGVIWLVRAYLNSGIMNHGVVQSRDEGTPQGGPLSPLLANVMLDEVDKELERRGHRFARYADDANVYVRSVKAGERVMALLRRCYAKLHLVVNESKSAVASVFGRKFLGYSLWVARGGEVKRKVAEKPLSTFKQRIRELTGRSGGRSMAEVVQALRPYMLGWKGYFQLAQTPGVWQRLDEWLRHRLRAIQLKHWKRGTTMYRELLKLDAPPSVARQIAANSHRWWHNSAKLLNSVLTIAYFDRLGVPRLS
ncbi:group II intron reverse transcriptase/maturase [Massilia sp. CCM 9210]|uniref:group II intron reverse transcriptase/maturase n=1 Tax=Massilia scottii TaxID=3057166 RepID=UPI002796D891|nr:group II intron reverse transcriptase/maturase [Massilia sp. CCM 9210]MDQ1815986.1 group II intron reverse transcriptase/maturase [Massilia sp. CCM 9210]